MGYSAIWLAILALTSFNLALSFKSDDYSSPHIIGGSEVTPHSHPYHVLIKIKTNFFRGSICGGSLISSEWVVSAAHCCDDAELIFAIFGAHNKSKYEPTQQMKIVSKVIAHPAYNPENLDNDIALLKVEPFVVINDYIQSIRLPSWSQRNSWFWRQRVMITGWGRDSCDIEKDAPTTLQSVESKVVTNLYCRYRYGFEVIKSFHICVDGSDGKSAYEGDSGGPMVMTESDGKYTLLGITSMGKENAEGQSFPSVFTRVASYLEWISRITGIPIRK